MKQEVKPPYTSYNPYFLYPFVLWVLIGGFALVFFSRQNLFAVVNTNNTDFLDVTMVWITKMGEGVFGVFILILLLGLKSFRNWWYFSAAAFCNIIPALLTQGVKSAVNAPRPLNYFKEVTWLHHLPEWDRLMERSFPSGHTCAAFSLFCFLAFILVPRYKWAGFVFFVFALAVGYSRIYLAQHFFLDVYVGSVIGVILPIIVVALMRRHAHRFYTKKKFQKSAAS